MGLISDLEKQYENEVIQVFKDLIKENNESHIIINRYERGVYIDFIRKINFNNCADDIYNIKGSIFVELYIFIRFL